ncbi:carboxylesterase family protein [Streptomyces sp. NPDC058086]|uniref:carboxylesterase family protein n=1 Tax=Streptomyces sp. NPDC058086 TaxID=3346334 RepID=UPI0036F09A23
MELQLPCQTLTREEALNFLVSLHGGDAQALYERHEAQRPSATPAQVVTDVETETVFQGGVIEIATHHAAGGNNAYVYQWDFRPEPDVANLGATHCGELPFLFGTFDSYPDSPMLGRIGARTEALWRSFAGALASFVTTGFPNGEGLTSWQPYAAGSNSQVLHFGTVNSISSVPSSGPWGECPWPSPRSIQSQSRPVG